MLNKHLRALATPAAVLLVCMLLFAAAAAPERLAGNDPPTDIQLEEIPVGTPNPPPHGRPYRTVREVNQAYRHIDGWISAVGAAGAIADIEGIGRPADICLVDPRDDSVSVQPAPGSRTADPYAAFSLNQETLVDPQTMAPMGCLPGDFNEDGWTDLLVYYWGRTPIIFLRSPGAPLGPQAFVRQEIGPPGELWYTNAALSADIDGDGHPDLVIGNYFPDGSRVLDSRIDDRAEMQRSMSRAFNAGSTRLLLWRGAEAGAVSYEDRTLDAFPRLMLQGAERSVGQGWTLALGARDLDGDLLPELYIANDFGPDRLLHNVSRPGDPLFRLVEGSRDLTTPRSKVLGRDSFKGMGVDFAVLNNQPTPSIAVSNISAPYALIESHFLFEPSTGLNKRERASAWRRGVAPYRDNSFDRGVWFSNWGWDIRFADLDNSGRPALLQAIGFMKGANNRWPELQELAMSNDELLRHPAAWPRFSTGDDLSGSDHDRLFIMDERGRFHDVWRSVRRRDPDLDDPAVSRGIATGDVYGDGRLSVLIARQWGPSVFLRNRTITANRSIVLRVLTPGAVGGERPLIGAVAWARGADGWVSGAVDGGSGHSGKVAPEIHLGLGPASSLPTAVPVEILWRDARGPHCVRVLVAGKRASVRADEARGETCRREWESNR